MLSILPRLHADASTRRGELEITKCSLNIEEPTEEYVAMSERLEINEIPLLLVRLERVLQEETVGIYDYSRVTAYLQKQCDELKSKAVGEDRLNGYRWEWRPVANDPNAYRHARHEQHLSAELYNKPIPWQVMPTIDRIAGRMPEARFFVSDIRAFKDPFLMVTIPGADKFYVIERWDEPSFR